MSNNTTFVDQTTVIQADWLNDVNTAVFVALGDGSNNPPTTAAQVRTNLGITDTSTLAPKDSPTFTGTPLAPTAATNTDTTQIATTAYVKANLTSYATLASPTFTGTPTLPTGTIAVKQSLGNNTTAIATTSFVYDGLALKANLASPTFTGTPAAPTAAPGTNTTQLATTAFVEAAVGGAANLGIAACLGDILPGNPSTFNKNKGFSSSIGGTGTSFTLTFSSVFSDANYVVLIWGQQYPSSSVPIFPLVTSKTTSGITFSFTDYAGVGVTPVKVDIAIWGD